jgi:hypothetical protein
LLVAVFAALSDPAHAQFRTTTTNGTITITGYTGTLSAVIIPSTITGKPVTSIGANAFFNNSKVTSVTIPDSVTSIGANAFASTSMFSVVIGTNVTSIGDGAFAGAGEVGLFFQGNAPAIGANIFNNSNPAVYYVPGSTGWSSTFAGQPTGLWNPSIQCTYTITNNTVTITGYIGSGGAVSIPSTILVNGANLSVTSIGDSAFEDANVTSVVIADGITSIGNYAFEESPSGSWPLTSVSIGNSVTSIGISAFANCSNLTSVTMGNNVISIGDDAFAFCRLLTSITLPNSVTSIGANAFNTCTDLTNALLPTNLTSVGVGAFTSTNLTTLAIPANVTNIGDGAFEMCYNLTSATIPPGMTTIAGNMFNGCYSLSSVTIPTSVTSIGDNAFQNTALTSFTIPAGVISIGNQTFANCIALASVTIPGTVTSIGEESFGNTALTSVTIPGGLTSIGDGAFIYCANLTAIIVEANNPAYSSVAGVLFNKNQTILVAYPGGITGNYTIPNSVTTLELNAFDACNLTGITIPSSITSIPSYEFQNSANLTSITINGSVTSIGDHAFTSCPSLTSVYFTGNAPTIGALLFLFDETPNNTTTVYYLPGTTGWGSTFSGVTTVQLNSPYITSPPAITDVMVGSPATFTVAATGVPSPSYQWQVSTDAGNTWSNISGNSYTGATTANLTITNATTSQLGYQFKAAITNSAGTTTTVPVPLVVGTSHAKLSWLHYNFTSAQLGNPRIIGDSSAPAGDSLPNLLKYAFNLSPWVDGHSLLPQPFLSSGNLVLSFQALQSDINYTVQTSTDLITWGTAGVTTQTNGSLVTASCATPPNGPVFLQIVVTSAP